MRRIALICLNTDAIVITWLETQKQVWIPWLYIFTGDLSSRLKVMLMYKGWRVKCWHLVSAGRSEMSALIVLHRSSVYVADAKKHAKGGAHSAVEGRTEQRKNI